MIFPTFACFRKTAKKPIYKEHSSDEQEPEAYDPRSDDSEDDSEPSGAESGPSDSESEASDADSDFGGSKNKRATRQSATKKVCSFVIYI